MIQLETRWGKSLDKERVLQEYPRPNMVRDSYINLNGGWDYCINQSKKVKSYDGTILVPFSPETFLSGVQKIVQPTDYLHYRKIFRLSESFINERVLLHFGAVDQECEVFLNDIFVGSHKGGYLPFSLDITNTLKNGDNELTLCVRDMTEYAPHARGKQKLTNKSKMRSLFYTPQSGIWKTVWLESVPARYIGHVKITPIYDEASVCIHITQSGTKAICEDDEKVIVKILDHGQVIAETQGQCGKDIIVNLDTFRPWTPDDPYLYDVEIATADDKVQSYFGMRKLGVGRDRRGILRFYLNGKPFFFNGILDQGYWPDGLMTAPSDEALLYDIKKLKKLGFNTIRKHIKIEPERFYYHCDREGMIVWQDMPNGGGDYNMLFVTYLPNGFSCFGRMIKDNHYGIFKRSDKEGRAQYYKDLSDMIDLLYNHPSVAAWVPFNEGWGQFDANKATALIREKDKTRLINEACGWFDQKGGDMYSIHNYLRKLKVTPKDRVVALTEYGGYAYPVKGHMACEKEFGYQHYKDKEDLTANYRKLWEEQIYPNLKRGLCSAIYTQTSDIEEEINGLMTYDREEDKFISEEVRKLNKKLYKLFDKVAKE